MLQVSPTEPRASMHRHAAAVTGFATTRPSPPIFFYLSDSLWGYCHNLRL